MAEKEEGKKSETEDGVGSEEQPTISSDIPDDFYERLGVSPNASTEEINSAWKKKIKSFHPDNYQDPQQKEVAEEWTKSLNEARQTLGDDEAKRKKYDKKRAGEQEKEKGKQDEQRREAEQRTSAAREAAFGAAAASTERENDDASEDGEINPDEIEPDETIYDLSSAKEDKLGWFVFVDGYKVYISHQQLKNKKGDPIGPPRGAPINPLWRKQASIMTPGEKFYEQIPMQKAIGSQKIKDSFRSLLGLNENPEREKMILEQYEALVRSGRAKFMGELAAVKEAPANHPQKNLPDMRLYKVMRKRYAKKGSFDNYEFKLVGVYDEDGRFTGKTRLYRIEKAA